MPDSSEVITPLQKILVGTFLLSIIVCPILGFALYLSPLYKAPTAWYRGAYFVTGLGAGLLLSFLFTFFWMTYLPGIMERRAAKKAGRTKEKVARQRADEARARQERADAAAERRGSEEE